MNSSSPFMKKYEETVNTISGLKQYDRYEGAFIGGSFVSGKLHPRSDLDIVVLVSSQESCANLNQPKVNDIKLDISFNTMAQLQEIIEHMMIQSRKQPWLYESIILFDKKGRLHKLKQKVLKQAQPTSYDKHSQDDYDEVQFELYYKYTKPSKYLTSAPGTANLIMHMQLESVMKIHYQLNGKWWVGDKRMLADLEDWDKPMFQILTELMSTEGVTKKYGVWIKMFDYILEPLGGHNFERYEGSCSCEQCQTDVDRLYKLFAKDQ